MARLPNKSLIEAVKSQDIEKVRQVLKKYKATFDKAHTMNPSLLIVDALSIALNSGNQQLIDTIINTTNRNKIFIAAAHRGNIPVMDKIISIKDPKNKYVLRAAYNAAKQGHLGALKYLETLSDHSKDYYENILLGGALADNVQIMKYAESFGANDYYDVLSLGKINDNLRALDYTYKKSGIVPSEDDLVGAVQDRNPELVNVLLKNGANVPFRALVAVEAQLKKDKGDDLEANEIIDRLLQTRLEKL